MKYEIELNSIEKVKHFSDKIQKIQCNAIIRSKDKHYIVDAKSIMGVFGFDLTRKLILEIENYEEDFIKELKLYGIRLQEI